MVALDGQCDCGAVRIKVPQIPARLTECPCDFCRSTGVLWGYYPRDIISVTGETDSYRRAARRLAFHRCAICGVLIQWTAETVDWINSGVNMRNFNPASLAHLPVGPPE